MHHFEATELAARVLGIDPEADDFDEDEVEQMLYDKFEVSMESFQGLAEALLKFTPPVQAAITNTVVQGYIFENCFIAKEPTSS
jgi:hypothetical protein